MRERKREAGAKAYAGGMSGAGPALRIILSAHAAEAIELGGIDRTRAEATIADPDRMESDPNLERTRPFQAIAAFCGRVLRVVHRPANDGVMVITTFFDRGAKR